MKYCKFNIISIFNIYQIMKTLAKFTGIAKAKGKSNDNHKDNEEKETK